MKNLFLVFFIVSASFLYSQEEYQRWSEAKISYELPQIAKREASSGTSLLTGMQKAYRFLISDLDGDNCSFHPSCSSFLVEGVQETNIIQGLLMYSDRFVRDLNLVKSSLYPVHQNGHYYDPPKNYSLYFNKVEYVPTNKIVEE